MAQRAFVPFEGGENDSALEGLVLVLEDVTGDPSSLTPPRLPPHQGNTLIGHPEFPFLDPRGLLYMVADAKCPLPSS